VAPPKDWPPTAHVTGAWFLEPDEGLAPELERFLSAGDPPVYAGFGSMVTGDPNRLSQTLVTAARRAGRRIVLGAGWAGLRTEFDEDVQVVGETPHRRLFPRVAAVIHHGGAGTIHTAALAGVPQIVTPFFADQPFWARRTHALGISPPPLRPSEIDADTLADAIRRATSPGMRARAQHVGAAIGSERGVEQATRVVESADRMTKPDFGVE
jgi:sterol 3beta-glucosyltransferase